MPMRFIKIAVILAIIGALLIPALVVKAGEPVEPEIGSKEWVNTWTEEEYLGNGQYGATIYGEHRVFFDKADANKATKHKLTDNRPDYVLIQSAQVAVEIYPYYATFYDVDHEEVRVYEERWVVQRLFKEPDEWRDVGAWNPIIEVNEYANGIIVTNTYQTDYGSLTVEYYQMDGRPLKHNVTFWNTSGSTEIFRVVQRWSGIAGDRVNHIDGQSIITSAEVIDSPVFKFTKEDGSLSVLENQSAMYFDGDGNKLLDRNLQSVVIDTHPQGLKADFIFGDWLVGENQYLFIDPDTATLDSPAFESHMIYDRDTTYTRGTATYIYSGVTISNLNMRMVFEWDISGIDDGASITDTVFKYESSSNQVDCHIHEMLGVQPTGEADDNAGNQAIFDEAGEGMIYYEAVGFPVVGENQTADLGATADSDLESQLASDWFAIGIQADDEVTTNKRSRIYTTTDASPTPPPTLYVVYDIQAPPDPPTNVSATDGDHEDKVVITWTKSDGATKYEVFRDAVGLGELGDVATYDDSGATAATITNAGTVTASDGSQTAYVVLSLANESTDTTTHSYTVKAGNASGWSDASGADNGNRGVGAITYQWQVNDGGGYDNIGGATTDPYNYAGAPAGTISNAGTVTATSGVHTDKVVLSLEGEATTNGATYDYQCIVSASGASNGATTDPYNYTDAPAGTITPGNAGATSGDYSDKVVLSLAGESVADGATYDYQCIVSSVGASNSPQTSDNDDGYRTTGALTFQWQVDDGGGYDNIMVTII